MTTNYLYPYQIVHFIHDQNENGTRSIEFVPNSWIEFDPNAGCIMARYMEGPYTEEDKVLIRNLIKKEMSAPEGWPKFEVVCVGRASKTFLIFLLIN